MKDLAGRAVFGAIEGDHWNSVVFKTPSLTDRPDIDEKRISLKGFETFWPVFHRFQGRTGVV